MNDSQQVPLQPEPLSEPVHTPQPQQSPESTQFTLGGTWKKAWQVFTGRFWSFIALSAIPMIIPLVAILFVSIGAIGGFENMSGITTAWFIPILIAFLIFIVVAVYIALRAQMALIALAYNPVLGIREAYTSTKGKVASYIWVNLLAGLTIIGGLLLFVIPGIYVSILVIFSLVIMVIEGDRGMRAIRKSAAYVKGRWLKTFGYLFTVFIIAFIVQIILGAFSEVRGVAEIIISIISIIFSLAFTPFALSFMVTLYNNLRAGRPDASAIIAQKKGKGFTALAILGLLAPFIALALVIAFMAPILNLFQDKGYLVESTENAVITDEEKGISFTLPAGWTKVPVPGDKTIAYVSNDAALVIAVTEHADVVGSGNDITEEVTEEQLRSFIEANTSSEVEFESSGLVMLDGSNAYKFTYFIEEGNNSIFNHTYMLLKNKKDYFIVFTGDLTKRMQIEPVFSEITDSIDIE